MRLELPVRWSDTDKDSERLNELTDGKAGKQETVYTYGRVSIDSDDIGVYYDIDERTTMINDKNGKVYAITVPFDEFKKIFTEVTGKAIMAIKAIEEPFRAPKPRKGNKNNDSDGLDDILRD